jgi:hypothetical protein
MIGRTSAAAIVVVLGLGACTKAADTLDTAATEQAVVRVVEPRLEIEVDEVRCPSPIARDDGEAITCRVVLADEVGSVRVQVTPRQDGDEVAVELVDAVVDRAQVGRELHQALVAEYERSFTVDCGADEVVVAEPGTTISCTATDDAGRRRVTATVVDATGTLSFDLGDAGS